MKSKKPPVAAPHTNAKLDEGEYYMFALESGHHKNVEIIQIGAKTFSRDRRAYVKLENGQIFKVNGSKAYDIVSSRTDYPMVDIKAIAKLGGPAIVEVAKERKRHDADSKKRSDVSTLDRIRKQAAALGYTLVGPKAKKKVK